MLELLHNYDYACVAGLLMIQLILTIAVIAMVAQLRKNVAEIRGRVSDYLKLVLEDANDEEKTEEREDNTKEPEAGTSPERMISRQELQMQETIRQHREEIQKELDRRREQEELFAAVLQEIFP